MPLFADNIIVCLESSKVSKNSLLELTSEFYKIASYKVNM